MAQRRVLLVDDEELFRSSAAKRLKKEGLAVTECETAAKALAAVDARPYDAVLLDVRLPDGDGMQLVKALVTKSPGTPVVLLTAFSTVDAAVEAIKLGAYDYLTKPISMEKLTLTIQRALETRQLRREVSGVRKDLRERYGLRAIIGRDPAMKKVIDLVAEVARSDARTIMLRGESGSGKSLLARAIHYESPRAPRPFVQITCTTLQDTLLESELFGHEKGSFTDAKETKRGLFEVAEGGSVFLDEISEMSISLQAKLLQVLDDRSFRRIGGVEDFEANVRVIAATNRDLEQLVREGRFREDPYFRLNIVPIVVPPLRQRKQDIPELARRFIDNYNQEFRKQVRGVSPAGVELLLSHPWTGNVRELKNTIERAVLLSKRDVLEAEDLIVASPLQMRGGGGFRLPPEGIVMEEVERDFIRQALGLTGGSLVKTAKLLGITKDTLRYRLKKFNLQSVP